MRIFLLSTTFLVLSCQSIKKHAPAQLKSQDDEIASHQTSTHHIQGIELKQAKIWSRLDEMEQELGSHKEKIKLLEQALLLGINPQKSVEEKSPEALRQPRPVLPKDLPPTPLEVKEPAATVGQNPVDFETKMALAKSLFDQGRFSKAYLEFSKIDKEFVKEPSGDAKFWMGRSWLQLNEYQNAKQQFSEFVGKFPQSPLLAPAKYYLAQSELALGLREQAIAQLQDLITAHPYEASAEEAKIVLKNMSKTL